MTPEGQVSAGVRATERLIDALPSRLEIRLAGDRVVEVSVKLSAGGRR